ncbi:hypothetical protein J6590_002608 [Homalodisca vitripennis]|nr:hypothetical protein J6590_002608 [Homalodisca vitripennis]
MNGPDVTKTLATVKDHRFGLRKDRQNPAPSRYCTCSSLTCNCCREFSLPVVPVKGPGCATVSYLHDDAMMVTMSFGERVLRNITINIYKVQQDSLGSSNWDSMSVQPNPITSQTTMISLDCQSPSSFLALLQAILLTW